MAGNVIREFILSLDWRRYRDLPEDSLSSTIKRSAIEATLVADAIIGAMSWLTRAAENIAKFQEAMYYAAQRDRASVESMQAFSRAVANLGATPAGAQASFDTFAKNLRANNGYYQLLEGLGVKTKAVNGKMRDTVDLLNDLGQRLARMPYQQQVGYAALFGLDERTLRAITDPTFGQGVARYREIVRAGGFDPQGAAKAWVEFNNGFRDLMTVIDLMLDKIATRLIKEFGGQFEGLTKYLVAHSDEIVDTVVRVTEAVIKMAEDFYSQIGGADGAWVALNRVFQALALFLMFFVNAIRGVAGLAGGGGNFWRGLDAAGGYFSGGLNSLTGQSSPRAAAGSDGGGAAAARETTGRYETLRRRFEGGSGRASGGGAGTIAPGGAATAQRLAEHLMAKYGLTREQAIGAVGVMAYESGNFTTLQEQRPDDGGKGGYGFAQWTGPRRRAFMEWAQANGLNPASYEANEGFFDHELGQKNFAKVIPALKAAGSARESAYAFEWYYEGMRPGGAGVPAFEQHMQRAELLDRTLPANLGANPTPSNTPASGGGMSELRAALARRGPASHRASEGQSMSDLMRYDARKEPVATNKSIDLVTHVKIEGATSTADAVKRVARHQAGVNAHLAKVASESLNA